MTIMTILDNHDADLHVEPDVPLLQLPSLWNPGATRVRPGVRPTDVPDEQSVALDHKLFACSSDL